MIISYWLIRTPGCGAALPAWTPVVPEVSNPALSNESHADCRTDGALELVRGRGRACIVLAAAGGTV
ncbi:MAG TPA: hypothetical protein VF516_23615, partial [Kofleriaceae bacterium]